MQEISSQHNPRIKQAMRLRNSRGRQVQGRTLLDGYRELMLAQRAGIEIVECFVTEDSPHLDDLTSQPDLAAKCILVPRNVMAKISYGQRETGLVAVINIPNVELGQIQVSDGDSLIVVLDAIEKPGNLGAVLRTADAIGATAVVLSEPLCDVFNPNAVRASQGTVFTVPTARGSRQAVQDWLLKNDFRVFAARVQGSDLFSQVDLCGKTAIVLGNEAAGLAGSWSGEVTGIRIPMRGQIDSLNISTAAAVILYEAIRQRG